MQPVMAASGCLFNCLREVRLERFHQNFTERGLINCEQLSSLIVDDYSRFGIVSTDDRRRLFQLIDIIKSVQADGVYCQHGTAASNEVPQLNDVQQRAKTSIPVSRPAVWKEELPDVTRNGLIPPRKVAVISDAGAVKCPAAPQHEFIKPISNDGNYRVQYEHRQPQEMLRLNVTQETKVVANGLAATTDSGFSGTPKFDCRKTLNFSDSDLYSDGIDSSYFQQPTAGTSQSAKPESETLSSNSVAVTPPAAKLRPPQLVTTNSISSPHAFVIPAENQSVTRHRSSGSQITQSRVESQSPGESRQSSVLKVRPNVYCMKKSSFQNDDRPQHAYFPTAKVPSMEDPPTHIEKIYHSDGYNYGIPGSTIHSADKVCQYKVLNIFFCLQESFVSG